MLAPLRTWCRGYVAGASLAACSEFVAVELEAQALLALDLLGVGTAAIRDIIDQARLEARLTAPDGTSAHDLRALAALRILLLIRARASRQTARAA